MYQTHPILTGLECEKVSKAAWCAPPRDLGQHVSVTHQCRSILIYLLIFRSLVAAVVELKTQVLVLLQKVLKLILLGKRHREKNSLEPP